MRRRDEYGSKRRERNERSRARSGSRRGQGRYVQPARRRPGEQRRVVLCSECAKVEYFSLIRVSAASPQVLREELLDHAREHGYSHCTIEDERSVWPEVTSPALFKRVTMIRNQEGMHYYECSDCLHVCNQNALDDHAKHIHAIE